MSKRERERERERARERESNSSKKALKYALKNERKFIVSFTEAGLHES